MTLRCDDSDADDSGSSSSGSSSSCGSGQSCQLRSNNNIKYY